MRINATEIRNEMGRIYLLKNYLDMDKVNIFNASEMAGQGGGGLVISYKAKMGFAWILI